jgi:hypothetical protein
VRSRKELCVRCVLGSGFCAIATAKAVNGYSLDYSLTATIFWSMAVLEMIVAGMAVVASLRLVGIITVVLAIVAIGLALVGNVKCGCLGGLVEESRSLRLVIAGFAGALGVCAMSSGAEGAVVVRDQ